MNNFAVLTIAYSHTPTSVVITITTNNPCHLTCYYTDKEPGSHRTSRNQRGLTLPWGVYYCFVAWKSVEQQEAGDTLIHTFEIPDWSYCQIKWFAFRGTVAGKLAPSVSPIFKHHHPGELFTTHLSPFDIAHYLTYRSSYTINPAELYAEAHDATDADSYYGPTTQVGQRLRALNSGGSARLLRVAIIFPTDTLPPCTVETATLRAWIFKAIPSDPYTANWDWSVMVKAGHDLNALIIPANLSNYSKILNLGAIVSQLPAETLPDPYVLQYTYIDIPIGFINITGKTALAIINSKDHGNEMPASNTTEEAWVMPSPYTRLTVSYYKR